MQFDIRTMTDIFGVTDYLEIAVFWGVPLGVFVSLWLFWRNKRRVRSLGRSVLGVENRPSESSSRSTARSRPSPDALP